MSRQTPRSIRASRFAFYDGGLGSRASGVAIRIKWWRRIYNFLGQTTGLGITQNIIDCYAEIIRVWQPGDRIYLFGFSRGAYTVRCVAGVLKYCGVPTAVVCQDTGRIRPLQRDLKSARRIATEAVKHVYQHGSSVKRDPYRAEREALAHQLPRQVLLRRHGDIQHHALFHRRVGHGRDARRRIVRSFPARRRLYGWGCHRAGWASLLAFGWPFQPLLAAFGLGVPMGLYLGLCLRYRGLASLARYRMAFYDTRLHYAVRYARHALAIDENRRKFDCVPWHEDHCKDREAAAARVPARFKQVWFAGSHSDIGGSYPDTESRLSDIALTWMVEEAASLPEPIAIDHSLLQLFPDGAGAQHDERKAFISACPGWLVRGALLFVAARNFGWREGHRRIPEDAILHPTVLERFKRHAVQVHGDMMPYRPRPLRKHRDVSGYYPLPRVRAARASQRPQPAFRPSQPHPSSP